MEQEVYEFKIDSFTPATLPMARLADYLAELSRLFGHKDHVHFRSLRKGSAVVKAFVDYTERTKVTERLMRVKTHQGPEDAMDAQKKLNGMLRADNAVGKLTRTGSGVIIEFPGRKTPLFEEVTVLEQGELDGIVIRVGGRDDTIPVWVRSSDGEIYRCTANEGIARELIKFYLADAIRVSGDGKWRRTRDEGWRLDEFRISSFKPLDQSDLVSVINDLRKVEGSNWNDMEDPLVEWRKLRGE